eukprot:1934784-Amphidinium_carterae.1
MAQRVTAVNLAIDVPQLQLCAKEVVFVGTLFLVVDKQFRAELQGKLTVVRLTSAGVLAWSRI